MSVGARLTLQDAIRALPPRRRAVLVLRYLEDLPEAKVAEILGCSVGTVRSQTHKAVASCG
jgi:RNA polymerase sigma factor (sigma-70 family)